MPSVSDETISRLVDKNDWLRNRLIVLAFWLLYSIIQSSPREDDDTVVVAENLCLVRRFDEA